MPLNPLSLDVTYGVAGRSFQATIQGLSSGSTVEVLNDGTPGFSTVNGRVYMNRLPGAYPVSTVVLRETRPGEGFRDSRIDIAVDGIALGAAGLSVALAGSDAVSAAVGAAVGPAVAATAGSLPALTTSTAAQANLVAAVNEVNEQVRAYTPARFGAKGDVRYD